MLAVRCCCSNVNVVTKLLIVLLGVFMRIAVTAMTANVLRLCAGGAIAFRLLVTEVQFIDKSSLNVLLLNVIRQAGAAVDACTQADD